MAVELYTHMKCGKNATLFSYKRRPKVRVYSKIWWQYTILERTKDYNKIFCNVLFYLKSDFFKNF